MARVRDIEALRQSRDLSGDHDLSVAGTGVGDGRDGENRVPQAKAEESGLKRAAASSPEHDDDDDADLAAAGELSPSYEARAAAAAPPFAGEAQPAARWEEAVTERAAQAAVAQLGMTAMKLLWTTPTAVEGESQKEDTFCVRHSPDDVLVGAGCADGVVRLYHSDGGRLAYTLDTSPGQLPVTCIRFRPALSASSATRNVLLTANSEGLVQHWHVTSKRCLHTITEENNQVLAADFTADASHFATAGKDYAVRVYDEATKSCVAHMASGWDRTTAGHSNRVFGLKFADANTLLSSGWDNTVQVWDVRTGRSERSIFGTHVCGDSLDVDGNTIVTGSWRPHDQLQMWDLRTMELLETVPLGGATQRDACHIYGAQFGKHNPDLIAAGGTVIGGGELRLISRKAHRPVGLITLPKGVYGVDFAHNGKRIAVVGADSSVRHIEVPAELQ